MKPVEGLSVIIIARDEERDLPGCLASIAGLSSDVVVADSGSTDRTPEIARNAGARVVFKAWEGYGLQKQFALGEARGPWVLNIDADERVTAELAGEIRAVVAADDKVVIGYLIPFRHFFLGRRLRFGRFSIERHLRLFRKSAASYKPAQIHEGIAVEGSIRNLRGRIDHYSYEDLTEYLEKCNRYTSMIAAERYRAGRRFHLWHHLRLPAEFVIRYVLRLGFLDGEPGLVHSALSSYYVWMKFLKLRDLERAERRAGVAV